MTNFYNTVLEILKQDDRFFAEDGTLLRNTVYEAAMKMDKDLIKSLFLNDVTREKFFTDIDGIAVFDKVEFGWLVNNREFLPNSYTRYKNKIGLVDSKGQYISNSNDVELVFPYKDCILEGGQTKDDQKRDEIFYNETLAPDEVDRLLYPKVFTNAKRYTVDGEEEITEFNDDNLVVKGNNLLAISSLLKRYEGRVKCIYIDPPYNTGNDSFGYNDNFNHSTWLTFMKNRLQLAEKLLSKDGLIFIQIDCSRQNAGKVKGSSELGYLMVLCDDIFGRANYIGQLHWKKKKQPSYLSKIAGIMETILIYSKDETQVRKLALEAGSDSTKKIDNATNKLSIRKISKGIRCKNIKDGVIKASTYQNKTMSTKILSDIIIENGRTVNGFEAEAKFLNTQSEIDRFCKEDLFFITENISFRRDKDEEEKNKLKSITDLLLDWGQNQDANDELMKLFDINDTEKIFDTPKPELLLNNLILSCTNENEIVLDFFAGSGTTCSVAHKLKRKYIGIEQMDSTFNNVLLPRLNKVIQGEQGGISKSVNWQGGGSFVYCELAKLNQNYVEQIEQAQDDETLSVVWNKMQSTGFISSYVDPKEVDTTAEDFAALSFGDKKKLFMKLLDKNQLYVNYCDIDDEQFAVSEKDKAFTRSFYEEV